MNFDEKYVRAIMPKRPENSNKGTFGHILNIAGSGFYTGAAYFSSISPLKTGCGKVTLASVEMVLKSVSTICPDIILMPLEETEEKTISSNNLSKINERLPDISVISIGCGLSMNQKTALFFENFMSILETSQVPLVIDADGLNILAESNIDVLPQRTILTPHPKELSRLLKTDVEDILSQPEFWVKKCCENYNCVTVLKLHNTLVWDNKGNFYVNKTGNSALSHAGSGDVLCGMISGLLAQGLNPFEASILGVYLHGLAGEIASKELTEYSVLASDLIDYIPKAIKNII